MHITLHTRAIPSSELESLVQRRARYALGRFNDQIRRLTLNLEDVNGPKGGNDIVCRGIVEFAHGGSLVVKSLANSAGAAASEVLLRLRNTIQRSLERERDRERR